MTEIHTVIHKLTGAKVPVIVLKVNEDNIIEKYREHTEGRKGYTVKMLEIRWGKDPVEVVNLLQKYQVPAHVNHNKIKLLSDNQSPMSCAIFFEEYILAIEKKEKLSHKKVKPILPEKIMDK